MPLAMCILQAFLSSISNSLLVAFLTANTAIALYRARGQLWTEVFVASAYLNLLMLFGCLRIIEKTPRGDLRRRTQLKTAILCLATTLNVSFCHQVSKWMPPSISLGLWCLVLLVAASGFWVLFVYDDQTRPLALARDQ